MGKMERVCFVFGFAVLAVLLFVAGGVAENSIGAHSGTDFSMSVDNDGAYLGKGFFEAATTLKVWDINEPSEVKNKHTAYLKVAYRRLLDRGDDLGALCSIGIKSEPRLYGLEWEGWVGLEMPVYSGCDRIMRRWDRQFGAFGAKITYHFISK